MNTETNKKNIETETSHRRRLSGAVVSDKMKDTAVVVVGSYTKHSKYQKYSSRRKRYKAHNPGNTAKIGDKVVIEECRPISKDKHFVIVDIQHVEVSEIDPAAIQ